MRKVNFEPGRNLLHRWAYVKDILPKEVFWEDLRAKVKRMIKGVLEYGLNKELEAILRAERYRHTRLRQGYRNGYRKRSIVTHIAGRIDNLLVPRSRRPVRFKLIERYRRRLDEFDYAILNCFLNGSSTRKTANFFHDFFSESNISHQTVSNILKRLDAMVSQYLKRPLSDEYPFLIVDAKYIKISPENKRKRPCIFCIGIRSDLTYEVLYFKVVSSESEVNYINFFFDLRERGIEGDSLQMLVCDGNKSIENAFLFVYPNKDIQICSVHHVRGALVHVKNKRSSSALRRQAYDLYRSRTRQEFLNRLNRLKEEYGAKEPKFLKALLKDIDKTLTFYNYHEKYRSLIKSTNLIERFLRDIEQLTRYWAGFRDIKSANRVMYLLAWRFNRNNSNGQRGLGLYEFTHFC